jgi:uncharacterized membrane protein YcaP (DUF421 family)
MHEMENIKVFDWKRMFYSNDVPVSYLLEIGFRTILMFLFLIIALKLLSKRGVKQLSVFELAILIALGSATGEPIFYQHVPLFYGCAVILVIIGLYKLITSSTAKSGVFRKFIGRRTCLPTGERAHPV